MRTAVSIHKALPAFPRTTSPGHTFSRLGKTSEMHRQSRSPLCSPSCSRTSIRNTFRNRVPPRSDYPSWRTIFRPCRRTNGWISRSSTQKTLSPGHLHRPSHKAPFLTCSKSPSPLRCRMHAFLSRLSFQVYPTIRTLHGIALHHIYSLVSYNCTGPQYVVSARFPVCFRRAIFFSGSPTRVLLSSFSGLFWDRPHTAYSRLRSIYTTMSHMPVVQSYSMLHLLSYACRASSNRPGLMVSASASPPPPETHLERSDRVIDQVEC